MEKEREGLFGRLVQFWKEKINVDGLDKIGFWQEKKTAETPFSEMGAVAALSQRETKQTFWEKTAEEKQETQENLAEETGQKESKPEEGEKQKQTGWLTAEILQEREWKTAKETESKRKFFRESPEETERRKSIPMTAEAVQERKFSAAEEGEAEKETQTEPNKAEKQAEPVVDIEQLMRQMTKKLWEEREGCGRRLR